MAIMNAMIKKMQKDSYAPFYRKYGPGMLIITERDDLFSDTTLAALKYDAEGIYQSVAWRQLRTKNYTDRESKF